MTAPPHGQNATDSGFPRERRFIFVQLLFSLTAAEIARQTGELYLHGPGWREALPAYAHLALATAVVITSWVGWSASPASSRRRLRVDSVFGWPMLVLLTDVALVVLYFILVRGAEIPKSGEHLVPSAENETVIVAWVFVGYFLWDVLTKAVVPVEDEPHPPLVVPVEKKPHPPFLQRVVGGPMRDRGWVSLVFVPAGVVAWLIVGPCRSAGGVVWADACLLSLVLAFRAMKERHWKLSVVFGVLSVIAAAAAWHYS